MPMSALSQIISGLPIAARDVPAGSRNCAGPIELMGARMTFDRYRRPSPGTSGQRV